MLATFHAWWTVLLLAAFVGIVMWAWSGRQRSHFDRAANIPFDDDPLDAEEGSGGHQERPDRGSE